MKKIKKKKKLRKKEINIATLMVNANKFFLGQEERPKRIHRKEQLYISR